MSWTSKSDSHQWLFFIPWTQSLPGSLMVRESMTTLMISSAVEHSWFGALGSFIAWEYMCLVTSGSPIAIWELFRGITGTLSSIKAPSYYAINNKHPNIINTQRSIILHGHLKCIHLFIQHPQQIFIKHLLPDSHCARVAVLHKSDCAWKQTEFLVLRGYRT